MEKLILDVGLRGGSAGKIRKRLLEHGTFGKVGGGGRGAKGGCGHGSGKGGRGGGKGGRGGGGKGKKKVEDKPAVKPKPKKKKEVFNPLDALISDTSKKKKGKK